MLRYSDPTSTPPGGGYPYTQKETNFRFNEVNLNKLLRVVKSHRIANNLPIGTNANAEIEDASCRELMSKYPSYSGCVDDAGFSVAKPQGIGITQVFHFLQFIWQVISKGIQPVSQEEANRRAEICVGCPLNIDIGTCVTCRMKTLLRSTKKHVTPSDSRLKVCAACGCLNSVKVSWPVEPMKREGVEYPPHCWMND